MSEQTENQRITGEIIDAIVEYDAWRDNLHPNDLPLAKARIMKALEDKDASLSALRKERDRMREALELIKARNEHLYELDNCSKDSFDIASKALTPRQEERGK